MTEYDEYDEILDEVDKDTFNWAYKLKTELGLK